MAKINTIALKIPNLGEAESTEIIEVNINREENTITEIIIFNLNIC